MLVRVARAKGRPRNSAAIQAPAEAQFIEPLALMQGVACESSHSGTSNRLLADFNLPATLIGSSLGGTLAILAAERFPQRVDRLVLMAPAVMFAKPGHHLLPPERVDEWRRRGSLPFFHYADEAERELDVAFYEDSLRYDAFAAAVHQPALIFQGLHDASVDYRTVEAFARARANITLSLLDDDHQLSASLPRMWNDIRAFLELDA